MNQIRDAMLEVFQDPNYRAMPTNTQVRFNEAILAFDKLNEEIKQLQTGFVTLNTIATVYYHLMQESQPFKWRNCKGDGRWLIRESERYSEPANS